jgi:hypothetical protein
LRACPTPHASPTGGAHAAAAYSGPLVRNRAGVQLTTIELNPAENALLAEIKATNLGASAVDLLRIFKVRCRRCVPVSALECSSVHCNVKLTTSHLCPALARSCLGSMLLHLRRAGLTLATSALRLGTPSHICPGTEALKFGSDLAHLAGTGLTPAASAPGGS